MIKEIAEILGLNNLIEFIKKRVLTVVLLIIVISQSLFIFISMYPLSFTRVHSIQTDDSVKLHNTNYSIRSVERKEGGKTFKLSICEVTKTVRNNLVEK